MGKCKDCGAPTVEGEEYCESCLLLRDLGLSGDNAEEENGSYDGMAPIEEDNMGLDDMDLVLDDSNMNFDGSMGLDDSGIAEELNIDEDILSFLNSSENGETKELNAEDIEEVNSLLAQTEPEEAEKPFTLEEAEEEPFALEEPEAVSVVDPQVDEEDITVPEAKEKVKKASKSNSDVGDILSDALGVLNDPAMDDLEKQIMNMMPEENKKEEAPKEKTPREKNGWFKKLFSNVPGPEPDENVPSEEEIAEKKKAEAEEKKKQKAAKKKESKDASDAKKKLKRERKAAKAAEKKRLKEEIEKNTPVDTSRINKAGASVVFVLAAVLAIFVIVGTNTFTYAQVVTSANDYLNRKQYTKAYQQISGVEIKKKDEILYDKIVTIMYVNKQYNSYQNYYNMEMYPESLDSLIKGLERYQKYKSDASELEIMDDMDYVKSNILDALKESFHLKENDVQYLLGMKSQEEYSAEVIRLAQK